MNKDYYFYLFAVAIFAAVVYVVYFYQTPVSVAVNVSTVSNISKIYPYQKVQVMLHVKNTGSSLINKMGFSLKIGNDTIPYSLTVPVGKNVSFIYNFTPTDAGNYNVIFTADPSKLYSVQDRADAKATMLLEVMQAENANPERYVNGANISQAVRYELNNYAYVLLAYSSAEYNFQTTPFWNKPVFTQLFIPLLNLTEQYFANASIAYAEYPNSSYSSSLWIRGYLNPAVVPLVAEARGYFVANSTINNTQVYTINLDNSTVCSWYSGGWTKSVAVDKGTQCSDVMAYNFSSAPFKTEILNKSYIANETVLGAYSINSNESSKAGRFYLFGNVFAITSIANGSFIGQPTCYGIISTGNDSSYCSTYINPRLGTVQGYSLFKTTQLTSLQNATIFTLINSTQILSAVQSNINLIKAFNISGTGTAFASAFSNSCNFNASFACNNMTFYNGTIKFGLKNLLNQSIQLTSSRCYSGVPVNYSAETTNIAAGQEANLSMACYKNGASILGLPLGLNLNLTLNYTIANKSKTLAGNAYLNVLSG